jgi:ribonuclease T2
MLVSADDGATRLPMVIGVVRVAFVALVLAVGLMPASAPAQNSRQDRPGQFDFYVLSLSWSPSFCTQAAERGQSTGGQCGPRPYSFVVHGLWPQYDKGFPEFCERPSPRLNRKIVSSMLDLMPARHLIYNEWDKHGTCSGLSARSYFDTVRKARAAVTTPPDYADLKAPLTVAPAAIRDAFIKANSSLAASGIAIECDNKELTEVRICLSKDLQFRDCPDVVKRACKRDQVLMPPVRGG